MSDKKWTHLTLQNGDTVQFVPPVFSVIPSSGAVNIPVYPNTIYNINNTTSSLSIDVTNLTTNGDTFFVTVPYQNSTLQITWTGSTKFPWGVPTGFSKESGYVEIHGIYTTEGSTPSCKIMWAEGDY